MSLRKSWLFALAIVCYLSGNSVFAVSNSERGLSEDKNAKNVLFSVGVSHGLPGIDLDVNNAVKMATDSAFNFQANTMMDEKGTTANIASKMTEYASQVSANGTFFFYFSGHGSPGSIYAQDRLMDIKEIRQALEDARKSSTPLERLVLMFDSCFSGSLLDPIRSHLSFTMEDERDINTQMANQVTQEFTGDPQDGQPYWKSLFVFASSRADETSLAGQGGSVFTVALKKAFDEVMPSNGSLADWVSKTQTYTVGHHPVARFAPATMQDEKMKP